MQRFYTVSEWSARKNDTQKQAAAPKGKKMDAMDFENEAIAVKEARIALFRRECMLASVAAEANAASWLAHLWAISTRRVNRLAAIWATFPVQDIAPDISLALYGAALDAATDDDGIADTGQATTWLRRALDEQWSPRQLRDRAGLSKGKHLSDVAFRGHDVEVMTWDVATGVLAVVGMPLSGEMPERAQVTVREILQNQRKDDDG